MRRYILSVVIWVRLALVGALALSVPVSALASEFPPGLQAANAFSEIKAIGKQGRALANLGVTAINVTNNIYGDDLVGNGTADNCAAWNALEAARPSGSVVYFPAGSYAISTSCNSGQGFYTQKPGTFYGDGVGTWNGTTFVGGSLLLGTFTSYQNSTIVHDLAVDISGSSVFLDGFDMGGGAAGYVGDSIYNWGANGRGIASSANYGHALLFQGVANSYGFSARNGRVFNMFHAAATRSSDTVIDGLYSFNGGDVIAKSGDPSGSVQNVEISNVDCQGPSAGTACGMYVTSESGDVTTTNVSISNFMTNEAAYPFVIEADNGGGVYNVSMKGETSTNSAAGEYLYYGDSNSADSIYGVQNTGSVYTNVNGTAFQNSAGATGIYLDNTYARVVSGTYTIGTFYQPAISGWSVWTGNAADASLYSCPMAQGSASACEASEYPTGSSTFNNTELLWSNTAANGQPGVEILGTNSPYSTRGAPGALTAAHSFANDGTYVNHKMLVNDNQTGLPGLEFIPPSTADYGTPEVWGLNPAGSTEIWGITKGGFILSTGINSTGGVQVNGNQVIPNTAAGYAGAAVGSVEMSLHGTTGTVTGTALSGSCDSGTATVTGAAPGQPVAVSSTTGADVGAAFNLRASVTAANTVTVYVCGTGTPASLAYNVSVF